MLMRELIVKKRDGNALTAEEITFMITDMWMAAFQNYQMSAMLMAILLPG
jgi:pyrimidine-nucleoside phosphorylase